MIGSLLYLFLNVFKKRDIEKAQESLVAAINPSKKIKDLEKKFKFSATFENQVALADAYLDEQMYPEAIANYQASLKDMFFHDFYVISKLVEACYFSSDFANVISQAERISDDSKFRKSKASFLYGMALEKEGDIKKAEEILKTFDAPYSNFMERLELARFFVRNHKIAEGKMVYQEMVSESENMSKQSYRTNREIIKRAKEELLDLT
ncbi:MAG: hypothetical protein AAGA43_13175 [Bacteroidota bacterium]